jgi:hypothetical protein
VDVLEEGELTEILPASCFNDLEGEEPDDDDSYLYLM